MQQDDYRKAADYIYGELRMKTLPVGVKFLTDPARMPEKTRRPSVTFGKKVTICQGVTMARNYGWTVGLTREDLICVPAMIVFGFSDSQDPPASLVELFCRIDFSRTDELARLEVESMNRFDNGEISAIVMAPLGKGLFDPDTILFFGNPAQMMRFAQGWSYVSGERVRGLYGGKVECDEYLIAPFREGKPRMAIPGNGDRIFSMTQDDEMVFALPGGRLADLVQGLESAGRAVGARYPVTPYQNFQPEFPKAHKEMGKQVGVM
ncbi:MAG: DUF169 domain-containing protein [Syntrophobacteraceae bacterium]|nr:DUF169 domain-containing protein [Syntrophobacteraceae bacterium]